MPVHPNPDDALREEWKAGAAWRSQIDGWKAGFRLGLLSATAVCNAVWVILLNLGWLA